MPHDILAEAVRPASGLHSKRPASVQVGNDLFLTIQKRLQAVGFHGLTEGRQFGRQLARTLRQAVERNPLDDETDRATVENVIDLAEQPGGIVFKRVKVYSPARTERGLASVKPAATADQDADFIYRR